MDKIIAPGNFIWGAATASYQIEGSPLADGASPSIWHEFSHRRGKIKYNHNGDTACDHYHRYPEDVKHMKDLGLKAYRFSVSWPRIIPSPGKINPKGLDFYKRLVDELLKKGIEPYITLFHWDAPLWLEETGGFAKREAVDHLVEYGMTLFKGLGDRVKHWITINEPMVFAFLGYYFGSHAPGKKMKIKDTFSVTHHLLLGHSFLVRRFRETVKDGKIGISEAQIWAKPLEPDRPKDIEAADTMDQIINRLYIDPILLGKYPEKVVRLFGRFLPADFEADLKDMQEPMDFVGINYYTSRSYRYSFITPFTHAKEVPTPGAEKSAMWEIFPDGLYYLLIRLKEEYGNPDCYITENGCPLPEEPGRDPHKDEERICYLTDHIRAALKARELGVKLKGYFVWSLLDNFEWQHGYGMRFGLIRVDFETLKRTWRQSARWYRDLIRSGEA